MVPNPGSEDAYKLGCICPVLDNGHGNEELGRVRGWVINPGCPVHTRPGCDRCGDKKDEWDD